MPVSQILCQLSNYLPSQDYFVCSSAFYAIVLALPPPSKFALPWMPRRNFPVLSTAQSGSL